MRLRRVASSSVLILIFSWGCAATEGAPPPSGDGTNGSDSTGGSGSEGGAEPSDAGAVIDASPGNPGSTGDAAASIDARSSVDARAVADATVTKDASTGEAADDGGPPTDPASRTVCTGTSPIVCHFGGSPGNYAVTVVLGGGASAATSEVQAETSREMLGYARTTAGETQRYSFIVNVRQPEGQPAEAVEAGTPGLDLYFYGSNGSAGEDAAPGGGVAPQLEGIGYAPATSPLVVYVAGDSTVCDQTDTNYAGWAQFIPSYFRLPIAIANYADSGESSVSFLANAKLWGGITSRWRSGDWVVIQFGHNDKTTTSTVFHDNITTMVTQAKAAGVHPLLVTPPARATFSGAVLGPQFQYTTPLDVVAEMKLVASEQSVPILDITGITTTWYNGLGPNGWQAYHALGTDQTHTNRAGASAIAGFVAQAIRDQGLALANYIR
jgi:lysophospholipase L1-like esterase